MEFGDIVYKVKGYNSNEFKKGVFISYYDGGGEPFYGMQGHDKFVIWEGSKDVEKVYRDTPLFFSIDECKEHLEDEKVKEIERLESKIKELKSKK